MRVILTKNQELAQEGDKSGDLITSNNDTLIFRVSFTAFKIAAKIKVASRFLY